MKNLASVSFFRALDLAFGASNPGFKLQTWPIGDVTCEHERHSFSGRDYRYTLDVVSLRRASRSAWQLLVVKELWWGGEDTPPIRTGHWSKLLRGRSQDVLTWLRQCEHDFGRGNQGAVDRL